jgi:hypothetical protein
MTLSMVDAHLRKSMLDEDLLANVRNLLREAV